VSWFRGRGKATIFSFLRVLAIEGVVVRQLHSMAMPKQLRARMSEMRKEQTRADDGCNGINGYFFGG
jgi:hypothetical protein